MAELYAHSRLKGTHMSVSSILDSRTMSAFPLSIGTALAFESLMPGKLPPYDPERPIPNTISLSDYNALWINVETLIRNIYGAADAKVIGNVMDAEGLNCLIQETDTIVDLVRENTGGKTSVIFYINEREGLKTKHPFAILREAKTPKQMQAAERTERICKGYLKFFKDKPWVQHFKREIKVNGKQSALMMTHQVYDLLFEKNFERLDLLESHTGVLKAKDKWHTKLNKGQDMPQMPFNSCSLQVFGDHTVFFAQKPNIQQALLELSTTHKWHAATTKERLIYCFSHMQDVGLGMMFKQMLSEV